MSTRMRPRFLSFQWKAPLVWVSIASVLGTVIGIVEYRLLVRELRETRVAERVATEKELATKLEHASANLQRRALLFAAFAELQGALARRELARAQRLFQATWIKLDAAQSLRFTAILAADGTLLVQAPGPTELRLPVWLRDEAIRTAREGAARHFLACSEDCTQHVMVPLPALGPGMVMAYAAPLAPVLRDFHEISGVDSVVLTPKQTGAAPASQWSEHDNHISGVTDTATILPILREAAAIHSGSGLQRLQPLVLTREDRHFEIWSVRKLPFLEYGDATLLLVDDVTRPIAFIRQLVTATSALIAVSIALLVVLLWGFSAPWLRRLRTLAAVLPQLGEQRYEAVRALTRRRRRRFLSDELDLLEDSVRALAGQLEALDAAVAARTAEVHERMGELSRERSFVNHLVDTTQNALLTLDGGLRVITVNRYGADMMGVPAEDLVGRPFLELCALPQGQRQTVAENLAALAGGGRLRYEHEGLIEARSGAPRQTLWLHSSMQHGPGGIAVLAAGIDVTDQRLAEQRMGWLSQHDALTGVLNRDAFREALSQRLAGGNRGSLLCLNVDNFRYVNDLGGHAAGDEVLRRLVEMLTQVAPAGTLCGRVGGDEFAAFVPAMDAARAEGLAAQLTERAAVIPVVSERGVHRLSVSLGIALYPEHGAGVEELLANADAALQEARETGLGSWLTYSASVVAREQMRRGVLALNRLRHALAEDRLVLHFQPILDLARGQVSHHEALIRLREADGTLVPPVEFIPAAERHGLIVEVDQWVIRAGIRALAALGERSEHWLSVNLSGPGLRDPDLPRLVETLLRQAGTAPQRLVFEVTETAAIQNLATAGEVMKRLRELGCRFALDDFGVGFSSLNYLRHLPVDFVKIDGSFIRGIAERPADQLMVRAMRDLAHGLGKRTIAEFVDSADTLRFVRETGIDYAQGFYIGRPESRMDGTRPRSAAAGVH